MREPVTEKEKEMIREVVSFAKRKGLDKEDGIALVLLSRGDDEAERMIQKIKGEPDIDFDELLEWAVKNAR